MGTTTTRAADYVRQSKDKKMSMDEQQGEAATRFADEGWDQVASLRDGKSASRHVKGNGTRDDWDELHRMIRGGELDLVWLWEASRGDRKNDTWAAFLALCRDHGVQVYVENDERRYNLEIPKDMKIMADAGTESEYEAALIQARTIRAKNRARRDGDLRRVYGGRARFGWQDTPGGWVVDTGAAAALNEAAERVIALESVLAIHADLHARGLLVDSYGTQLSHKQLRTALVSPLAAGLMTKRDGTPMGRTDAGGPLELAVWERVQVVFGNRRRGRHAWAKDENGDKPYVLGPILGCGKCGNQLTGEPGAKGRTYACANPHPETGHHKPCKGTQVNAAEVHAVIAARLAEWSAHSPRAKALATVDLDLAPRRVAGEAELSRLQDAQANLDYKRDRNRIKPADYQRNQAALDRDFDRVEAELAVLADAEAHPLPVSADWSAMTDEERLNLTSEVFATPIVIAPYRFKGTRASVKERVEAGLHIR